MKRFYYVKLKGKSLPFFYTGLFFVLYLFNLLFSPALCRIFNDLNFDTQALVAWDYLAHQGALPYRDVYYPYGILFFFKNQNFIFHQIYLMLGPFFAVVLFIGIKRYWNNVLTAGIMMIVYFLLIFTRNDIDSFNRYGILLSLSVFYSYIFTVKKYKVFYSFIAGLLNGIIFSFVYDQMIYGVAVFFFLLLFQLIFNIEAKNRAKGAFYYLIIHGGIFISGFIIASFAFIGYLLKRNMFQDFFFHLLKLSDVALYAKVPFFPTLRSSEGIFNVLILMISIFVLFSDFFSHKGKKMKFGFILMLSVTTSMLLVEQKNIIRSMDQQLMIYSSFLLILLIKRYSDFLLRIKMQLYYIISTGVLFYLLIFAEFFLTSTEYIRDNSTLKIQNYDFNNISKNFSHEYKKCSDINIEKFASSHQEYMYVINRYSMNKYKAKLYSFPGDPIFYMLLHSNIPYYFSVYEASPLYAQSKRIDYLKENKIEYVIINTDNLAIQDGVPNYVRAKQEFSYLIQHYEYYDYYKNFLILKKNNESNDIFNSKELESTSYIAELLFPKLGNIPKSEGSNKIKFIDSSNSKKLIETRNINVLNNYLKKGISTGNLFLIYTPRVQENSDTMITFETQDDLETRVSFIPCRVNKSCILNLSNIPLFYNERKIMKINISSSDHPSIQLLKLKSDFNRFW